MGQPQHPLRRQGQALDSLQRATRRPLPVRVHAEARVVAEPGRDLVLDPPAPRAGARGLRHAGAAALDRRGVHADRKSTRLNSSHVKISYAVFCLKKKKNNNKKYISYLYSAIAKSSK